MKRLRPRLVMLALTWSWISCGANPASEDPQCDHLRPAGWNISQGDSVLVRQWEDLLTGSVELDSAETLDSLRLSLVDEDSTKLFFSSSCPDHEVRYLIGDTSVVDIAPLGDDRHRLRIRGKRNGVTSFRVQVWHTSHADYTSDPVNITVGDVIAHAPLGVDAAVIVRHCNDLASWNYDWVNGPYKSFGAVVIKHGAALDELEIHFLDTILSADGIRRRVVPIAPEYSIDWNVADPQIAGLELATEERWRFRIVGLQDGTTTISFRLLYKGVPELETGNFRVIVRPEDAEMTDNPSFRIVLNGWRVIVREGRLVASDSLCNRTVPARLELRENELTSLYSLRLLDTACNSSDPSLTLFRLGFDFEDACIAKAVNHPVHWGEYFVFHLHGLAPGQTSLRIHLIQRDNVVRWTSPPIPVVVNPA